MSITRINNNKVIREAEFSYDHRGKPLIVSIEQGDILGFRPKGSHETFYLTIRDCYERACRIHAEHQVRRRRRRK